MCACARVIGLLTPRCNQWNDHPTRCVSVAHEHYLFLWTMSLVSHAWEGVCMLLRRRTTVCTMYTKHCFRQSCGKITCNEVCSAMYKPCVGPTTGHVRGPNTSPPKSIYTLHIQAHARVLSLAFLTIFSLVAIVQPDLKPKSCARTHARRSAGREWLTDWGFLRDFGGGSTDAEGKENNKKKMRNM